MISNTNMDKTNLQVIRESFGRVSYSHKTHEKEVEIQSRYVTIVKWVNIGLIAITTGSLLGALFAGQTLVIIGAFFSALTLGFSIYQLSFDPEKKAVRHKQVANSLWLIREKYVNLMADIINGHLKEDGIVKRRDDLLNELDVVYKSAPETSTEAYKLAQQALKIDEELTFSDKELNQLLPASLHINGAKNK